MHFLVVWFTSLPLSLSSLHIWTPVCTACKCLPMWYILSAVPFVLAFHIPLESYTKIFANNNDKKPPLFASSILKFQIFASFCMNFMHDIERGHLYSLLRSPVFPIQFLSCPSSTVYSWWFCSRQLAINAWICCWALYSISMTIFYGRFGEQMCKASSFAVLEGSEILMILYKFYRFLYFY